jgi:hypothetical protein
LQQTRGGIRNVVIGVHGKGPRRKLLVRRALSKLVSRPE